MISKNFKKKIAEENNESKIIHYAFLKINGSSIIQRSLQIGVDYKANLRRLEYWVWQKEDAQKIKEYLVKNGFKKDVSTMPNVDGSIFEFTAYRKSGIFIAYEEIAPDSNTTKRILYTFKMSSVISPQ